MISIYDREGFIAGALLRRFLLNYASTVAFIVLAVAFYTRLSAYHMRIYDANWMPLLGFWSASVVIRSRDLFELVAAVYLVALVPYYAGRMRGKSKAAIVFEYLINCAARRGQSTFSEVERQAVLSLLLKFIFIPFCLNGLLAHCAVLNNQILALAYGGVSGGSWVRLYGAHVHMLLLNLIFIFDFVPFVVGYMVESRLLKNQIRTVDSSLAGWVVCLLCYPPFNGAVGQFFSWTTKDYIDAWLVAPEWLYLALNFLLVVLFALYASASVSLGFKCSNLTNRGVVASGLYGVVRHPAYALKNSAWWLAALPVFVVLFKQSFSLGLFGLFSLGGWSMLYVLRSITEERHMLRGDNGYACYCKRVPFRFIPGVL